MVIGEYQGHKLLFRHSNQLAFHDPFGEGIPRYEIATGSVCDGPFIKNNQCCMTDQELQNLMRECLRPYFENLRKKGSISFIGNEAESEHSYYKFLMNAHAVIINNRAAHAILLASSEEQAKELLRMFSEELRMFEVVGGSQLPQLTMEKESRLEEEWEKLLEDSTREMFPVK